MKKTTLGALLVATLPFAAAAQHFGYAYIDIRLVKPDSVRVTVEADGLDLKNTVQTFPFYDVPAGSGMASFRLYEQRIEAYLLQKVKIRADGKPVRLAVVSWKPGGQGREDGFDTLSIRADNQAITLGGLLPPGAKSLEAFSELWVERLAFAADGYEATMEYHLFDGGVPLRRVWSKTGRWVAFPIVADSLALMHKNPLPLPQRRAMDHSGHNH